MVAGLSDKLGSSRLGKKTLNGEGDRRKLRETSDEKTRRDIVHRSGQGSATDTGQSKGQKGAGD